MDKRRERIVDLLILPDLQAIIQLIETEHRNSIATILSRTIERVHKIVPGTLRLELINILERFKKVVNDQKYYDDVLLQITIDVYESLKG